MAIKKGRKAPPVPGVDFKGKKTILYFYPKDDTPGCTANACNFRDNYTRIGKLGYTVIGVSPDTEKKHNNFKKKYDLPFHLVPDTDHSICEAYGVWGLKKFMGREYMGVLRTTFVIDENGKITHVIDKVDTEHATEQLLEEMGLK